MMMMMMMKRKEKRKKKEGVGGGGRGEETYFSKSTPLNAADPERLETAGSRVIQYRLDILYSWVSFVLRHFLLVG